MTGKILIGVCVLSMAGAVAHGQDKLCETCVEYTLKRLPGRLQGSSLQFPGYDVSMRLPPTVLEGKLSVERLKDYVAGHDVRGDFVFPDGRTTEIKYSVVPYQGCKPRSDLRVWADIRGREAASTSSTSTDERLGEARRQQSR